MKIETMEKLKNIIEGCARITTFCVACYAVFAVFGLDTSIEKVNNALYVTLAFAPVVFGLIKVHENLEKKIVSITEHSI